jgi:hypothetical protein
MSAKFKVGDVVEIYNISGWNGQECVITGPLRSRSHINMATAETSYGLCYEIEVEGRPFVCTPEKLRPRLAPQDWGRLCALEQISAEVRDGR